MIKSNTPIPSREFDWQGIEPQGRALKATNCFKNSIQNKATSKWDILKKITLTYRLNHCYNNTLSYLPSELFWVTIKPISDRQARINLVVPLVYDRLQ